MASKRAKKATKKAVKKTARKVVKKAAKPAVKKAVKKAATPPARKGARPAAKSAPAATPEPRDHRITRAEAAALHKRHVGTRRARGAAAVGSVGGLFSRDAVLALLQQEGAQYLRFYYATHDDGTPGLVLAASDERLAIVGGADATLLNQNWQCPPLLPTRRRRTDLIAFAPRASSPGESHHQQERSRAGEKEVVGDASVERTSSREGRKGREGREGGEGRQGGQGLRRPPA